MLGKNALSGYLLLASLAGAGLAAELKLETLPQKWTDAERHKFWFIGQGSKIMPVDWFLHLERKNMEQRFALPENLYRYGFVIDTSGIPGDLNKNNLPIGFATGNYDGVEFVGLTCAACHTGNIVYNGRSILIEGAPAMLNFDLFLSEMVDAMIQTSEDPAKRERFINGFPAPPDMNAFDARLKRLRTRRDINTPDHPAGFGRVDAFGHIFNQVAVEHLGNPPEVAVKPNAPASYPMLWDVAQHRFVQWNYSAPNLGVGENAVGSLMRNIGEVLGVFGEMDITRPETHIPGVTPRPQYKSSAQIENLRQIEGLLAKLESPKWPFEAPADQAVNAGRNVYKKRCEHCHSTNLDQAHYPAFPNKIGKLGTDPDLATTFLARRAPAKILEGAPKGVLLWSSRLTPRFLVFSGDELLKDLTAHLALQATPGTLQRVESLTRGTIEVAKVGLGPYYKARPLNGIWASAPYLHNGSVPTLTDLLWPAAADPQAAGAVVLRPASFCVGDGKYDPVKVGYVTYPGPACPDRTALVDTTVPGSRNIGHEYGVKLSDEDKKNLVEYLKTL